MGMPSGRGPTGKGGELRISAMSTGEPHRLVEGNDATFTDRFVNLTSL